MLVTRVRGRRTTRIVTAAIGDHHQGAGSSRRAGDELGDHRRHQLDGDQRGKHVEVERPELMGDVVPAR